MSNTQSVLNVVVHFLFAQQAAVTGAAEIQEGSPGFTWKHVVKADIGKVVGWVEGSSCQGVRKLRPAHCFLGPFASLLLI